jgi:hypothetical protein
MPSERHVRRLAGWVACILLLLVGALPGRGGHPFEPRDLELSGAWLEATEWPSPTADLVEGWDARAVLVALAGPDWSGWVDVRVRVKGRTDAGKAVRSKWTERIGLDQMERVFANGVRVEIAMPPLEGGLYSVRLKLRRVGGSGDRVSGRVRLAFLLHRDEDPI